MLEGIEQGSDVVYARYAHKHHSGFRNWGSHVNELMTRVMLGKPKELYVSSYFAARRFVVDVMSRYTYAFPYVIGLVLRTTKNITNVDVNHRDREAGVSGYTLGKLLNLWFNGFTAVSYTHLLLTAVILLFRGLVRKHPGCLVAAGVVLGLNTLVRFPNNGLEVLLILTLWYYGYLKKKPLVEIAKETGLCIAGYAAGFVAVLAGMMLLYGTGTLGTMIEGVFGMAGSASDYTFGEMLGMIQDAYLHGAEWMDYMVTVSYTNLR